MNFLLIFGIPFLLLAAMSGLIIFFQSRKTLREQKNYERGLKMVPLLIHLPPSSEDVEVNGRDTRDVVEENISKAQTLYSIIASTLKKDYKSRFYGQRHFTFEIIGIDGFVKFYASVPIVLVDVVKQAVISAYPTAQLTEVAEHNIFSPIGKISGTVGGELTLKENYAYPIATYQELKRDALQSLLNALSTMDKQDGAGIQFLIRPADPSWRKNAQAVASNKRKGGKSGGSSGLMWWVKQLAVAAVKPPEDKSGGKDSSKPELSSLDQSVLDAIDDKTRYPGYEVLIRVVASSNVNQRAQTILHNIVAAFSLYDAQGKNGFKYTPSGDIENFVTSFILRIFPQESNKNILNTVELATLFHFPDQKNIPTAQLERQASKQVDAPRNMPTDGLLLGYNLFRGAKKPIRLTKGDRQRHVYAVGQTGTGKSTFLENLAYQDMLNGDGFAFVDPHGDTADKLLSLIPKERTEDVIYFNPSDMDFPMGLNLFEFTSPEQKDFLIQEAINILYKLYDPNRQGMIGARFEHIFTNCALLLMADPKGGTFIDIPKVLVDQDFMKSKLKYVTDQNVLDFWTKEWPNSQRSNESGEVTSWVVSKFGAFLSNQMMRNIIGQVESSFDIRQIMDNKKILLVNLSKGKMGDLNSRLMGMIFVMKFQAAAMSRANIPESERQDFCLYVDEFQNFSTDSFATIMSEARKYHLNLVVANQFVSQLTDEIRDAVFGNIGTIVSYRVGQNDVDAMSRYFQPLFDADDLLRVPNYNAIVRTLIGGVPTQPFSMAGLPYLEPKNNNLGAALKQLSSAKYGRPKAQVEKEIFARLATAPKAPMMPQQPRANRQVPQQGQQRPSQPIAPPSFLDDWLKKRNVAQPAQKPVGQPIMNNPQLSASQLQNTAQQPHVASPAQPINYAPTTFQQPTQPMPQNPVLQPLTQPQPQPQPQTEQEHIKIQTGQHSNQAEDMIIIDR
jgi:hypothetical protein